LGLKVNDLGLFVTENNWSANGHMGTMEGFWRFGGSAVGRFGSFPIRPLEPTRPHWTHWTH